MTEHVPRAFEPSASASAAAAMPVRCLLVPGLNDSEPDHWQSRWQHCRDDCVRVELGDWQSPTRPGWVARIGEAVNAADRPVVLVGHSLGCLAIAWWAMQARASASANIACAMLVAPPDVGQQGCDLRLLRFAPVPQGPLPFRALVVASDDDHYASAVRARTLAAGWGAAFINIGRAGHINAASDLGDWPQGQALLTSLIVGQPL